MRFITTRVHGMMDYALGVLLIVAPWLLQFNAGGAETWVPVILGIGVIAYSLITRYELGAVGTIDMPTHLWLDGLGGALLAVSPWLFGFYELVWAPHLILGVVEIGAALCTQTRPAYAATARGQSPVGPA